MLKKRTSILFSLGVFTTFFFVACSGSVEESMEDSIVEKTIEENGYITGSYRPDKCPCNQRNFEEVIQTPVKLSVEGTYKKYRLWLDGNEIRLEDGVFSSQTFELRPDTVCLRMNLKLSNGDVKYTLTINDKEVKKSVKIKKNGAGMVEIDIPLTDFGLEKKENVLAIN